MASKEVSGANTGGKAGGNAFTGFGSIGVVKQMGLMLGLAISVALGVALVLWAGGKDYKPLDANINPSDLLSITQLLDTNAIAYKVDASNSVVMVESSQVNNARMKLAAAGLLSNGVGGFDNLDKASPLGSSQFMETARYRHALESEIAKTISSISNVRSARVHLAIPSKSAFIRDQQQPSASVLVERSSGRVLDAEQVMAIENLVASSVPELNPKNVTVVDQNGSLLSGKGDDPEISLASRQLDYTREVEKTMLERVNSLLVPIVGAENFKAEVSANIDFSQVEQTSEMFNPDTPAVRSEQTLLENRTQGDAAGGGIPGALSNQPPAVGAAPEVAKPAGADTGTGAAADATGASRKQDVRNYELDRSISYTKHQTGRVQRITVSVVVDDLKKVDGEKVSRIPWQAADLERLTTIVRGAVGYSAERGDSVSVVNSAFTLPPDIEAESIPIWQQAWVLALVKPVVSAIVLLALIFGLMRPVLKRLAENNTGAGGFAADYGAGELALSSAGSGSAKVGQNLMLPSPEAEYEDQLTAVKGLVAQDSERVAQVIKQWVAEDQ